MNNAIKYSLVVLLFAASLYVAFRLVLTDDLVLAAIGIIIINSWFFGSLALHFSGKVRLFRDDDCQDNEAPRQNHCD